MVRVDIKRNVILHNEEEIFKVDKSLDLWNWHVVENKELALVQLVTMDYGRQNLLIVKGDSYIKWYVDITDYDNETIKYDIRDIKEIVRVNDWDYDIYGDGRDAVDMTVKMKSGSEVRVLVWLIDGW